MKNILNILNQIGETSSRKEKELILKQNKDNNKLKDLLYKVYNPYLIYGIGKKGFKKITGESEFKDIFELLDYLQINNTGTDETKEKANNFINNQDDQDQDIYKKIVLKDLKIGITSKTINKIWKNLIPEFNVMLAKKYWDFENKVVGDFVVTQKLDGIRCLCVIDNDRSIKFFSRQGQPILGLNQLEREYEIIGMKNVVFDGELLLKNENNLNSDDLYRATVKEVNKDGIKHNVEHHVFDMLYLSDFKKGESATSFIGRREAMVRNLHIHYECEFVKDVPVLYSGNDKSMIIKLLNEAISKNQEGVMVNLANRKYECKRTDAILKVKKMSTVDLRIIGFEQGDGKNKGTLGATIVDYKGFQVKVGGGYSDYERDYIWNNRDQLLGKIMEVQYFEESKNQQGGISLRFPVFKRLRLDKNEVSYN